MYIPPKSVLTNKRKHSERLRVNTYWFNKNGPHGFCDLEKTTKPIILKFVMINTESWEHIWYKFQKNIKTITEVTVKWKKIIFRRNASYEANINVLAESVKQAPKLSTGWQISISAILQLGEFYERVWHYFHTGYKSQTFSHRPTVLRG